MPNTRSGSSKDVFTTGQVARLCRVTIRTVIKWFEHGHLEGYKIPGSRDRRFARDKVIEFMRAHGIPLDGVEAQLSTRRRVLIVDDEEAVLTLIESYLGNLGLFDLDTARNGYEAGVKTHSFRPHLLLIDYHLGDTTGTDVARTLRNNPVLKETRVIVMSQYLHGSDVRDILSQGVDDFVKKPIQLEEVRDKIFHQLHIA